MRASRDTLWRVNRIHRVAYARADGEPRAEIRYRCSRDGMRARRTLYYYRLYRCIVVYALSGGNDLYKQLLFINIIIFFFLYTFKDTSTKVITAL